MKMLKRNKTIALAILAVIVIFLLLETLFRPQVFRQSLAQQLYRMGKYQSAQKLLEKNLSKDKGIAPQNLAKTLYKQKQYVEADSVAALTSKKASRADSYYDRGDIAYQQQQYEKALEHFRKALLADPNDKDTKANYELTLRKLQNQPQQKQTPPQQQKQKQEQQKEEIKNILGGLDNKESSDRQQERKPVSPEAPRWW